MVITSVVLAIKFLEDVYYDNDYYSKVGGISCRELNGLESEMLRLMHYELFISPELYQTYLGQLLHCVANPSGPPLPAGPPS